jgi:stromal interaction molecule 1
MIQHFTETGTRWKDLLLVALVMTAIIGYWYFYNVDKSSKAHLKRMAQEMEQLQKAEYNLQSIQKVWKLIIYLFSVSSDNYHII